MEHPYQSHPCLNCRRRKKGCDKLTISCTACLNLNIPCIYPEESKAVEHKIKTPRSGTSIPKKRLEDPLTSKVTRQKRLQSASEVTQSASTAIMPKMTKEEIDNAAQEAAAHVLVSMSMGIPAYPQASQASPAPVVAATPKVYTKKEMQAAEGLLALWKSNAGTQSLPAANPSLFAKAKSVRVGTSLTQGEAEAILTFSAKKDGRPLNKITNSLTKGTIDIIKGSQQYAFAFFFGQDLKLRRRDFKAVFDKFIKEPKYENRVAELAKIRTDMTQLQEEAYLNRPSIKIVIPDPLKSLLVGDWENITRNNQLVPLPKVHSVRTILDDYLNYEKPRRKDDETSINVLEEIIQGLKVYFDKCLGRILLYSFERHQYLELNEQREAEDGELAGKTESEIYGAEHLTRLIVSLPELITQTNMDQQSTNRLRDEVRRFATWLSIHADKYFSSNYETPNQAYIDKARTNQN